MASEEEFKAAVAAMTEEEQDKLVHEMYLDVLDGLAIKALGEDNDQP